MSQVEVFVTEGHMDGRTDRQMSLNVPHFLERRGTITGLCEVSLQAYVKFQAIVLERVPIDPPHTAKPTE